MSPGLLSSVCTLPRGLSAGIGAGYVSTIHDGSSCCLTSTRLEATSWARVRHVESVGGALVGVPVQDDVAVNTDVYTISSAAVVIADSYLLSVLLSTVIHRLSLRNGQRQAGIESSP